MKLLIQSLIVFFATLMAAGLVALGEPGSIDSGVAATSLLRPLAAAR